MENEELFAGETALDSQQQALSSGRTADVTTRDPLHVHSEPILANVNSVAEWSRERRDPFDADKRPRWRRPTVRAALR